MRRVSWLPPVTLGLVLLLLWWYFTTFGVVNSYFLPAPKSVLTRIISGLNQGYLLHSLTATLGEALLGCFAAGIIGVPCGYFVAKSRLFHRLVGPYLAASQAVPAVAIAPLLTMWVGYGTLPVVLLCTIMVIFPVIVSTSVGIYHMDKEVIGAARLDGASGLTMACSIELPLAAPSILAGIRTGFTFSVTGAIVGEMVTGAQGLGMLLISAQHSGDTVGMFAVITMLALCAMTIYGVIGLAEKRANYHVISEMKMRKTR